MSESRGSWSTKGWDAHELLHETLALAVPLWIERCARLGPKGRRMRAQVCANHVGTYGDLIQFRGSKPGRSGEVFNRLAEGIAIAAFQPGGITAFGWHFEAADRAPGQPPLIDVAVTGERL